MKQWLHSQLKHPLWQSLKPHRLKILLGLGGLVVAALILVPQLTPDDIEAVQLTPQDLAATLTVTGEIKAHTATVISSDFPAKIASIAVEAGDAVQTGTVLVTLQQGKETAAQQEQAARAEQARATLTQMTEGTRREELARLNSMTQNAAFTVSQSTHAVQAAEKNAEQLTRTLKRYETLYQQELISLSELDDAETKAKMAWADVDKLKAQQASATASYQATQSEYQQARNGKTRSEIREAQAAYRAAQAAWQESTAQRHERTLRAQYSGMITERLLEPGETVTTGQAILKLANFKSLEVLARVEEIHVGRLRVGQAAYLLLDAYPDQPVNATLREVGHAVNPDNGTVEIRLAIDWQHLPKGLSLLPGMTTDVNIITQRLKQALILPASAIITTDLPQVYAFENGQLVLRPVQAVRVDMEHYQILKGLREGEWVVLNPADKTLAAKLTNHKTKRPKLNGKKG